jgi:hypothetical protein
MKAGKLIIALILFVSFTLGGCGEDETHVINSGLLENIDLNDVTLTIY